MSALVPAGPFRALVRLHARTLWVVLAAACVSAGALVWAALHEINTRPADPARHGHLFDEAYLPGPDTYASIVVYNAPGALLLLPVLVAAYAAGPLSAREFESGTASLLRTQSVSPTRWFTSKLVLATAVVAAGVLLLTATYRWAWTAHLIQPYERQWFTSTVFPSVGPALAAYCLLGLALGLLVGGVLRRTLPAVGLTLAALGLVMIVLHRFRGALWPVTTTTSGTPRFLSVRAPDHTFAVDRGVILQDGSRAGIPRCGNASGDALTACLDKAGVVDWYADYHPASHFWPLQLVETGILLLLAALAAGASYALVRRRTAPRPLAAAPAPNAPAHPAREEAAV
ncbi:ABC transporter permease [Streptomyces sp. NPDC060194]|uniref:ABC transporter permease n=1 Tax=Streptomyces sp. NPDC060194 TaxID=3347069 RepID=UPI003661EDD2